MNITTTESAREALKRETEIGGLAARLRVEAVQADSWTANPFEQGVRVGLSAYRECYELVRLLEPMLADRCDTMYDPTLATAAAAALERARG